MREKIKKTSKNEAITLIALIITVVIVLILAAITLNMVTSNNGIFKRTKDAVEKYDDSRIAEEIKMAIYESKVLGNGKISSLEDIGEKLKNRNIIDIYEIFDDETMIIVKSKKVFQISNKDGIVIEKIDENTSNIITSNEIIPTKKTPIALIKIKAIDANGKIVKIIFPDETEKTYNENKIIINEEYYALENGTYTFKIVTKENEKEYNVEVTNIEKGIISLVQNTEEWTKENVEVEILWPQNSDEFIKEYSIDEQEFTQYSGKLEISTNCTITARMRKNNITVQKESLVIENIDKNKPNAEIQLEGVTFGINANVISDDKESGLNFTKCKYVLNNSTIELGENEELYTEGNLTDKNINIQKAKSAGTYYLHVLLTDMAGNQKEVISNNSTTVNATKDFEYKGSAESIELIPGKYQLEVWGAQGGYRSDSSYAGKGGYSKGTLTLSNKTTLNAYVGGSGNTGGTAGGYNGGGSRSGYAGGGGATDFRINSTSLYARVIVAGGGGSCGASNKKGMYGGGTSGGTTTESYGSGGAGATQTSGYSFGTGGYGSSGNSGYAGAGGRRMVWRIWKLT